MLVALSRKPHGILCVRTHRIHWKQDMDRPEISEQVTARYYCHHQGLTYYTSRRKIFHGLRKGPKVCLGSVAYRKEYENTL